MSTGVFFRASALALSCFFTSAAAIAQDRLEDLEQLHARAREALISHLHQSIGAKQQAIEVKMLPLDPRLRLVSCDGPIDHQIVSPPSVMNSATVKIACTGTARWTLYAPAQVALFGDSAVATRNLERGSLIQPGDFQFVRQNLSLIGANYVDPSELIIGQELKRSLRAGEPLRQSFFEPPRIVQRGDRVTLEAQSNGLSVAAPGMAMANGKIGERIQVKNAQSNKIVDALVVAPGRVRVKYD
jgi:flagellar basal body P-ring formation protein FlgA